MQRSNAQAADATVEPNEQLNISLPFRRKFKNLDMATCWLNACLQLVLAALDHKEPSFDISSARDPSIPARTPACLLLLIIIS